MVFEMVVSTRYTKLWKSSRKYIFQSSFVILQHAIIFPVMVETNQLSLNFFTIINMIKFGRNVIPFLIPKQSQMFTSAKGLLKMIATITTTVEKKNNS